MPNGGTSAAALATPQNGDRPRPKRAQIEPVALELIRRHGKAIMATARRYSSSVDDAEDAYQRGLEILLTKAPSTSEDDLVPWLKTVVKHEAFAIRRSRIRAGMPADDPMDDAPALSAAPHDHAERYERLRMGAEAMARLKPQEIRALLLRAEGYSYQQICELTGWTYTKVNRCLTEGRRSFLERIAGIESGAECERMAPLLSALADGEAAPAQVRGLRAHLRSCLSCRATLREYRAVPQQVAALAPPAALAAGGEPDAHGGVTRIVETVSYWLQDRAALLGVKLHGAVEVATSSKLAAVAASTAALAGGGVATVETVGDRGPKPRPVAEREAPDAEPRPGPAPEPRPAPDPEPPRNRDEREQHRSEPETQPASEPPPAAAPEPAAPPPAIGPSAPRDPLPSTPSGGGSQSKGEPGAGEFGL